MIRLPPHLGLLLVPSLAACASGAPTVDVEPVTARPGEMPIEWFAEALAPFDASRVAHTPLARGGVRPGVLVIVDGEQVEISRQYVSDGVSAAVVRRIAGPALLDPEIEIPEDAIRHIRVVRAECEKAPFGPSAASGAILVFTRDWTGPLPEPYGNRSSCSEGAR